MVSIQVVATPTSGRARSSSVKPIALSIDRAPARSGPSVSAALWRFAGSLGWPYGSVECSGIDEPSVGRIGMAGGGAQSSLLAVLVAAGRPPPDAPGTTGHPSLLHGPYIDGLPRVH